MTTKARHDESRSPSASPAAAAASRSPRALISRLTAPFSPRPRHITDLHIDTNDPHRIYSPGDAVKGVVRFVALKPLRLTHVVIQVHGFVKVYKNATPPGEGVSPEATGYSSIPGRKGSSRAASGPGFATIFEDEQVLCRSGSLSAARYEIPFNVQLPQYPLPSSLDFERGTISYVLTAILTRPAAVAPTMIAERKIELREIVDVASMSEPIQRAVTLKPLAKRSKARNGPKLDETGRTTTTSSSTSAETEGSRTSMSGQSALSGESGNSGCRSGNFEVAEGDVALFEGDDAKTVSASVELLRGGYLPGDLVPVRVTVKHTKPIKAMQGVIVTLYRRAKIDLLPELDPKDGLEMEPKGLSGFFFLAAGSLSHTFRYDLDQNVAPLIINPNTMQGEAKIAVRIPEDVFPSITSVPHGLMSFTYHIEVVMDLMGKLSGLERFLPRLSLTRTDPRYGAFADPESEWNRGYGVSNNGIMDTSPIRRLDSIAHCTFLAVVGTNDSKRRPAKRVADPWTEAQAAFGHDSQAEMEALPTPSEEREAYFQPVNSTSERTASAHPMVPPPEPEEPPTDEKTRLRRLEEQLLPSEPPESDAGASAAAGPSTSSATPSAPLLSSIESDAIAAPSAPAYLASESTIRVPQPTTREEDAAVDEKTRLRRAEAALLPSAPDDEDQNDNVDEDENNAAGPSAPPAHALDSSPRGFQPNPTPSAAGPSAPPYAADSSGWAGMELGAGDDKQELERRRLLAQASSPDDDSDDSDHNHEEGVRASPEASAPALEADNAADTNCESADLEHNDVADDVGEGERSEQATWERVEGSESLPQYQR